MFSPSLTDVSLGSITDALLSSALAVISILVKVVKSNPKIAPILASQSTDTAALVCAVYDQQFDDAVR